VIAPGPAILLAAIQAAAAAAPYRDEADLFTQVCTLGGGRFPPSSIVEIPAVAERAVRDRLSPRRHNRYYRVRLGEREAYLILQDTIAETDPNNLRYCSVATREMNFGQAVRRVFPGREEPMGWRFLRDSFFLHTSPLGHRINIQRAGRDHVVMTAVVPAPEAARNEEVLRAFRDACEDFEGRFEIEAKHAALGWEPVPENSDPRLERAASHASAEEGAGGGLRAFRLANALRPVFLLVTRAADGPAPRRNTCRLYDFEAGAPIDPEATQQWLHSIPARVEELAGGGSEQIWIPGWGKDTSIQVRHITRNSPLAERSGFSGNVLVVRSVGDP